MLEFSPLSAAAGGTPLAVLLALLVLDLVLGFVPRMGHLHPPLPAPRRLLAGIERRLNRENRSPVNRAVRGAVAAAVVVLIAAGLGWGLWRAALELPFGIAAEAIVLFLALSQARVIGAMAEARDALRHGAPEAARAALGGLVAGGHEGLDGFSVARAMIEQGGMGFLNRLIAPAFWFVLAGLPGAFVYGASLALAAAFAPRSGRGDAFSRAAMGIREALDYIPARLAALILILAGLFLPGASPAGGIRVLRRDGARYPGVNGGWILATLAGLLGLALLGPKGIGVAVPAGDPWIGGGRAQAGAVDIRRAVYLLAVGALIVITAVAGLLLLKLGG
jgi:adenosylcobinamide-phosphate synthase